MAESRAVTVCRLEADDWQAYRAIRLAMLEESPSVFGSTHAEAASFDEELWRQRLTDNVVILASVGASSAGSVVYSEFGMTDPGDCALFGMWVDPGFRGTGIGRALVDAVVAQARAARKRRLVLHVVTGNDPASRLYERAGFVPTGHTVPFPLDNGVVEVEMELVLRDGP
ncbi:MAG TPA: GNAT family N-acetyltransferase [Dermatophilaceae bacterium]|jgi:ribosomal protein S18 acetylase RimI-like enzyme